MNMDISNDCLFRWGDAVNIETIWYVLSVPFLYRFRYNCQLNVGYYVVLSRFLSYIENSPEGWPIQGIPFGWKYYLALTPFSSCSRYARWDSISDKEHSQMLITTELQQSVQSIALLSGNWNLLSVFCQQLSYFFYSYAFLRLSYIYITLSNSNQHFLSL